MTPEPEAIEVQGRRVEFDASGRGNGAAVIFHTGTPSAGRLFEPLVQAGAARGLRHVAYSRPGYGGSERRPARTVADCVREVVEIADHLGIERFYTVGWSGGGPHALACAALLGERVIAAATLASIAPYRCEGLDWLDGMGEENQEEFAAAQAGEPALQAYIEQQSREMIGTTGEELRAALGDLLSETDRAALSGDFAQHMAQTADQALRNGIWGWFDDDIAIMSDWGFELGAITTPVTVWQGGQDRMVPFAHGQWLADNVAGARPRLLPDAGHLSLPVGSYDQVLDDLIGAAG
jgi:pimeloyl-ACP methyl ester carboxylesterase